LSGSLYRLYEDPLEWRSDVDPAGRWATHYRGVRRQTSTRALLPAVPDDPSSLTDSPGAARVQNR